MSWTSRIGLRIAAATVAVGLILAAAAPSANATRFTWLSGYRAPGSPLRLDRVGVLRFGPSTARNVLVLNPGTSAGSAYFAPLARTIVRETKGWQVWSVERRENRVEDQSVLEQAKEGKVTPRRLFDYYLGWITDHSVANHFQLIPDSQVGFARKWGMAVEVNDLRRVVQAAEKRGGKVVLGGHSLGGSITTAYATWDFHGQPGAKGLSGLVFIDGASSPTPITRPQAEQSLQDLQAGSPWLSFGGIPAPFAGLFSSGGAAAALIAPNAPSLGQAFPGLPANLKPPVPVTNLAQFGYALDTQTSPPALAAAQAHLGHLAPSGSPRGWDHAGELTPILRYAKMLSGWTLKNLDGVAWYHPLRLTIDAGAVAAGNANPAQKVLGVQATHGDDLPRRLKLYGFAASLGGQRVLDATRALATQSKIPSRNVTLIDRHRTYAHNDPNTASPSRNLFLRRLVPFLKGLAT
jgi:pimeloyl-ACP methyl ester carboxylesterase